MAQCADNRPAAAATILRTEEGFHGRADVLPKPDTAGGTLDAVRAPLIRVERLTKVFPFPDGIERAAVQDISFEVHPGEIYGLLGPNGAGKTTTLRMVSGLLRPTSGAVFINGLDVTSRAEDVKRQIGFLTANTGLYARLSVVEVLRYFAELYDLPRTVAKSRIEQLVDMLSMHAFMNTRCGALSTGQKQRTNIARALIADPPILVMDEPTLGLDVISNRLILEFISTQAELGKAILLSTHALDEIERMCRRIGLIHRGRLVAEGTLQELYALTGHNRLSDVFLHLVQDDAAPVAN
jgi:sodium transport system ATP-binding protein